MNQGTHNWILPRDLDAVKVTAFTQAMLDALAAWLQYPAYADKTSIQVQASAAASRHETAEDEGKQGANDPKLFRDTFVDTYVRIYPAMNDLLEMKPALYDELVALSQDECTRRCMTLAAKCLESLESLPRDEPIALPTEW